MYEVLINVCALIIGVLLTAYHYERKIDRLNKKHDSEVHQQIIRSYNEGWREGEEHGRRG